MHAGFYFATISFEQRQPSPRLKLQGEAGLPGLLAFPPGCRSRHNRALSLFRGCRGLGGTQSFFLFLNNPARFRIGRFSSILSLPIRVLSQFIYSSNQVWKISSAQIVVSFTSRPASWSSSSRWTTRGSSSPWRSSLRGESVSRVSSLRSRPEPARQRAHEPLLPVVQHLTGQQRPHAALQQVLLPEPFHLELRRDRRAVLHQFVVQERHAHLQGVAHAEPVRAGQDVVGEVRREVAREDLVQRVLGRRAC